MDRIAKFLKRPNAEERAAVDAALAALLSGHADTLDIKRLKGHADIYRVRVRNIRIIFKRHGKEIRALEISRGSADAYRNY